MAPHKRAECPLTVQLKITIMKFLKNFLPDSRLGWLALLTICACLTIYGLYWLGGSDVDDLGPAKRHEMPFVTVDKSQWMATPKGAMLHQNNPNGDNRNGVTVTGRLNPSFDENQQFSPPKTKTKEEAEGKQK